MEAQCRKTERRKKVRHFDEVGHAHFLTFSCYRRLPLLGKDRSGGWFVDALEAARRKHMFELWAWVIMPEHVHLLIFPGKECYRIASILADIKRPVGQAAVDWLKVNCPEFLSQLRVENRHRVYHRFWQAGPGQDRNVYDPATAHQIVEYIHNNPVTRGLVEQPEDWPWSSAADWAGHPNVVMQVDKTIPRVSESMSWVASSTSGSTASPAHRGGTRLLTVAGRVRHAGYSPSAEPGRLS